MTRIKMKKSIYIFTALILFASCDKDQFKYGESRGTLSFASTDIVVSEEVNQATKAEAAGEDYSLFLYDSGDRQVWKKTWGEVKSGGELSLLAGDYRLAVRSTSAEVPDAKFGAPVYGASKSFSIKAGETTSIGTITCYLLQAIATVSYNDAFLEMVTGDGNATVELKSGFPLEYALSYNGGAPKYELRQGYFALSGENSTMYITFKGMIDGKNQKMSTSVSGVHARDWHIITFMKKTDASGNASFQVEIDGLVEDLELGNDITAGEDGDGNDPQAPVGDGGIELVSTSQYDITKNIIVPASGEFPLTMTAKIPGGTRKFTVDIASTNDDFIGSVNTVGGTTLDLINPSEAALGVFDIVPFPHGAELAGKTEIEFDLSGAQTPLLAFKGTHIFTMNVTDNKGCRKSIPITLVVE